MKNIKLTLEFDGSRYVGWQKQKNGISVQQKINEAVVKLTGENCHVTGCSRTDAGVHARNYVCNFKTESEIPVDKIRLALNNILPEDIVALKSEEVQENFHARYNAKSKIYIYTICNRKVPLALGRQYAYSFRKKLNLDKMVQASSYLIGKHDFSAFKNSNSKVISNVRTIFDISIFSEENNIWISVTGDGFLYNMVRVIVGTLLNVGLEKIETVEVFNILESRDRKRAGSTAPALGLCLEEVYY
jgi:tRNA pseudouridine38-40 synthase